MNLWRSRYRTHATWATSPFASGHDASGTSRKGKSHTTHTHHRKTGQGIVNIHTKFHDCRFVFFLTGACWPRWLVVSGKDLFPHFLFLLLLWHHHQEQNGASWRFCSNDCWLDSKKRKRKKESHFLDFPVYSCSKFKFRLNRCLKSNRHLKSKQNRYGLAPFQTYLFQWMKWRIIPRLGQHNQRNGELSGCWALATAVHYI